MIVTLQTHQLNSIEQVREFILGTDPVVFGFSDRKQAHLWMIDTLCHYTPGYLRVDSVHQGDLDGVVGFP